MSQVSEQKLPQLANIFCQIGPHDRHPWLPLAGAEFTTRFFTLIS
jgi:hypothetical protein